MKGSRDEVTPEHALDEAIRVDAASWTDIGGNASKARAALRTHPLVRSPASRNANVSNANVST